MKRVFARPVLLAMLSATSVLAQSSRYDVRKERWGMSQKEVIAAEGHKPDVLVDSQLRLRDDIAGIPAHIYFYFDKNKLCGVQFVPDAQSTPDAVESAFRAWLTALHRRYGYDEGYLFVDEETTSNTTSLEKINAAFDGLKKGNISQFQVQFPRSARTDRPSLSVWSVLGDKSLLHMTMDFSMLPPDNF